MPKKPSSSNSTPAAAPRSGGARKSLSSREKWFREIVQALPNATVLVDTEGRISYINRRTEELFGYTEIELLGQGIEVLVPARYRTDHLISRTHFLNAPSSRPMGAGRDLFGLRKDGTEIQVEIGLNALETADGSMVLASVIDISERKEAEERSHLFNALVEGGKDYAMFMLDPAGFVSSWSDGAAFVKGYSAQEVLGRHFSCFYTPEDRSRNLPEVDLETARREGKFETEAWRIRQDGSRFWASILITAVHNSDGELRGFAKLTRDFTDRRRTEERLHESERSFRFLADSMPQIVWTATPSGNLDYVNDHWYEYTGMARGCDVNATWRKLVHPEDLDRIIAERVRTLTTGEEFQAQYRHWDSRDQTYRWCIARALPQRDHQGEITKWVGFIVDIDEQKRIADVLEQSVAARTRELEQSLREKTTLLLEVHHRVKNNLQVICSLLSMQIHCSKDALAQPLMEAHHRVLAMSMIHELLYRSETLSDLNFGGYIELLSGNLFHAYCLESSRVHLQLQVEPIHLSVDDAIPCGLILNELLSNAMKHSFKDCPNGLIRIGLRQSGDGRVELSVSDNGAGLPDSFDLNATQSLGLQIVRALVQQLGGELAIGRDDGASFVIRWNPARHRLEKSASAAASTLQ